MKGFHQGPPRVLDWLAPTYLTATWLYPTCQLPHFTTSYTIVSQKLSPYFDNFKPVFHFMQWNSMNDSLDTDMNLDYCLKMIISLQEQTLSYCSSSKCKKLFWNSHGILLPVRHTHYNSDCRSEKMVHTTLVLTITVCVCARACECVCVSRSRVSCNSQRTLTQLNILQHPIQLPHPLKN